MAEKAEKSKRKQNAISLEVKMELLKAVDEKRRSKTEICRQFGIANSTLSAIIKNRGQLMTMFERGMFEPERKRMRMAKHEDLETALIIWFKQAKSQNIPISGFVLMERANDFAKQLGITFSANSGWLERFKKRNGIVLKNLNGEANQVSPSMTSDCLQSSLPSILEQYCAKNVYVPTDEEIMEAVQNSKVDAIGLNASNEDVNSTIPIPTKKEMRSFIKSMRRYFDVHSNGEMNQTMDEIEQFINSLPKKKRSKK